MDDYKQTQNQWDDGFYGTGPVKPPKGQTGIIALLLILVIFLCGVITVLGVMNIRLFQQAKEEGEMALSFAYGPTDSTCDPESPTDCTDVPQAQDDGFGIRISESPQGSENCPTPEALSLQAIYEKNIPSVASITCTRPGGSATGTGVIFSEDGYLVTNAHVVEGSLSLSVLLTDGRVLAGQIVGSDPVSDLAVLRVEAEGLVPAEFGDSASLRVGDTVAAIGDPLGVELRGTYTDGIVSAINRDVDVDGYTMTLIQTNAALNTGNSGGPLINCYGQVIGINTMKIGAFAVSSGVEGIGFAIPSATVKDIVDQLISQGYVSGRPTMGIRGEMLSIFYQHYYHLPAGLYITSVDPDSDAAVQGIDEGDILVSIDGRAVTTMEDLTSLLYEREVGATVTATIYRGGQEYQVDVELMEDQG